MNPSDSTSLSLAAGETGFEPEPSIAPFLIFRLGETLYALPALAVREIHALPLLAPLPETAPFVVGMFNLRGAIVPVVDLNARFGAASPPLQLDDKLIVLSWEGAPVALLTHEVRAVTRISSAQIGAPPAHGRQTGLAAPFVAGVAQIEDEMVLMLHLPHLLDFSLHSTSALAPRLDLEMWTPAQREILQERTQRLGPAALSTSQTDAFDHDAAQTEKRAPVAIFTLGGEEFATPLDLVREFASVASVASVPCCPPHILGQINLRGDIVTLVDVRATLRTARTSPPFFAPPNDGTPRAVSVVVVEHEGAGVGIAVDEVRDVLYLREEEWSALDVGRGGESARSFFAGGAICQGRLLPLLDIGRLLAQGGLEVDETA